MSAHEGAIALCTIYGRGGPNWVQNPPRYRWAMVLDLMQSQGLSASGAASALIRKGLHEEAALLRDSQRLEWAHQCCARGKILTPAHPGYPLLWRRRLMAQTPPVVFVRGTLPSGTTVGIVGSRVLNASERKFARTAGASASRNNLTVVSGGANGTDQYAVMACAAAGGATVEIWPYGLGSTDAAARLHRPAPTCALSLCADSEPFSSGMALARNLLIYAMSSQAIVVAARFKTGGSWHGAVDALRRRVTPIWVRQGVADPETQRGAAALVGLGAMPLVEAAPSSLDAVMMHIAAGTLGPSISAQPPLFAHWV
ncbi:MAG: DNA-processing protein DprA [Armatimonadetes bacterium]|nr:DNA-processing protein DprA [Armatimonadota bacterium]